MTRWIGLVRVSTDDQASGADTQAGAIRQWVADRGGGDELVAVFTDLGVPGTLEHIAERTAIAAAFEAIAVKAADGVIFYKLDRLARDVILQEKLIREFVAAGATVSSCSAEENRLLEDAGEDPSRQLIRVIIGAVSEYERATIRMRARAGRARGRAEGRYMGGILPYGLTTDAEGYLRIDEREGRIIGEAMTLRRMGVSYGDLAEFFLQSGLPPRHAYRGVRQWTRETVRRVLAAAPKRGILPSALTSLGRQFAGARASVYESPRY